MNKLLTISIAAYNVEDFIEQTLQSLICRKELLDRLEILVIDDGSKDRTSEVARKYEEQYPESMKVITKVNGGHGSTLNYSIMHATGRYFRMLDGDDWYDTDQLEQFLEVLDFVDADLILTPYTRVMEQEQLVINRHFFAQGKKYVLKEDTYQMLEYLHAAEATVRTSLLKENSVHITEHCCYTDDALVSYIILYSNTVIKYDYNVYRYRIGVEGQSVSNEGRISHWKDGYRVVKDVIKNITPDVVECDEKKQEAVYKILCNSLDFQYATLLLLDNYDDVRKLIIDIYRDVYNKNKGFDEYVLRNAWNRYFVESLLFLIPKRYSDNRKIVLVGAGYYGTVALNVLRKLDICVHLICDNNCQYQGDTLEEVPIVSVEKASELTSALYFIAIKNMYEVIYQQLRDLHIEDKNIIFKESIF